MANRDATIFVFQRNLFVTWNSTISDEDLIKYGFPEDVWFHVDKLSSAHVYLRLEKGQSWENIDKDLLTDCAQLCKANSIEGGSLKFTSILFR